MFSISIQAGGESRRMGQTKCLKPFLGKALIERVFLRLAPIADEVLITCNQPEDYLYLGARIVRDLIPGRGALGGLYTALSEAHHPYVAVVACDMPFVSPALLEIELNLLISTGNDLVIPLTKHGAEPFYAVYRRQACLPAIEGAIQAGKWRVDAWFEQVKILYLEESELKRYDPDMRGFMNVNTQEQFAAAEKLAREYE